MSHYYQVSHDILDKYELAPHVINEDIISYKPKKKYNLILSLSTLEHVGWDEISREKDKIIRAVKHLRTLLKKDGLLFVTLPLGYYNKTLQDIIKNNRLRFSEQYFMKRVSLNNM